MPRLISPHPWLDSLATFPDSDVSDLCTEVYLVSSEGDTTSIPAIILLATSKLYRQLSCLDEGKEFCFRCWVLTGVYFPSERKLIFPDVANVDLEQAVELLTTGTCGDPGDLRSVGRNLQQVQHVMNLLGTGIEVNLDNMRQRNDQLNNNHISNNNNKNCHEGRSQDIDNNNLKDSVKRTKKTKYNRRELKRLISAPPKSARPLSISLYCNLCGGGFPSSLSLRTHIACKHSESTFACSLCPQRFFNESSLNKHFVAKHSSSDSNKPRKPPSNKPADDAEDVGPTKNRVKCSLCPKFFASKVILVCRWFCSFWFL